MDILQELHYTAELLQSLQIVLDSLVTLDNIEYHDGMPCFIGKYWTPAGYAAVANGSSTIYYNGYVIHQWDDEEHCWKEGKFYPVFRKGVLRLNGSGGIIDNVRFENDIPSFYILPKDIYDSGIIICMAKDSYVATNDSCPELMIGFRYKLTINKKKRLLWIQFNV